MTVWNSLVSEFLRDRLWFDNIVGEWIACRAISGCFDNVAIWYLYLRMTIEDIQKICKKYGGVTEDIKWEDHLCFNVGGKMFLITAPDAVPISASLKVSDETFNELSDKEGFQPAPYLARYKWIWMDDIN